MSNSTTLEAPAISSRMRQCGACEQAKPRAGFRDGLCAECWKNLHRSVPVDRLLNALHIALGGVGTGMHKAKREEVKAAMNYDEVIDDMIAVLKEENKLNSIKINQLITLHTTGYVKKTGA